MKTIAILACIMSLCGCATQSGDPFGQSPSSPKIYLQTYGFQLDAKESILPEIGGIEVNSDYAMSLAIGGPAETTFTLMRTLQEAGIDFEAPGSFISIDPTVDKVLRIGSPYYRYYIVIANTDGNLDRADFFIQSKMKGAPIGTRKAKD